MSSTTALAAAPHVLGGVPGRGGRVVPEVWFLGAVCVCRPALSRRRGVTGAVASW